MFTEEDLIHAYTRKQAIEDRVLMDVTEAAKKAGFKYPVAITQEAAWAASIIEPERDAGELLSAFVASVRSSAGRDAGDDPGEHRIVLRIETASSEGLLVAFKAVIGPDDDGSPCVTVMLPHED